MSIDALDIGEQINFSNQNINIPKNVKYIGLGELGKAIKEEIKKWDIL